MLARRFWPVIRSAFGAVQRLQPRLITRRMDWCPHVGRAIFEEPVKHLGRANVKMWVSTKTAPDGDHDASYNDRMKKTLIILGIALLALTACGGGSSASDERIPKGATSVEPGVWVKDGVLYGTDCDRLHALTIAGGKFGPTGNIEDGTAKPGLTTICFDSNTKTDPYDVWLKNRPADAPSLSREDAQTRAALGCMSDVRPAPGTVDAILQAAYKGYAGC